MRDWNRRQAENGTNPQAPVAELPITRWSDSDQVSYMEERLLHQERFRSFNDESLPLCLIEMWAKQVAVKKAGNKGH